jgi:hypothetical protein
MESKLKILKSLVIENLIMTIIEICIMVYTSSLMKILIIVDSHSQLERIWRLNNRYKYPLLKNQDTLDFAVPLHLVAILRLSPISHYTNKTRVLFVLLFGSTNNINIGKLYKYYNLYRDFIIVLLVTKTSLEILSYLKKLSFLSHHLFIIT